MNRRSRCTVGLVVVLSTLVSGCTKEAPPDADVDAKPVVREGVIGKSEDLFGVEVSVVRIEAFSQSPESFPRLRVTMRSENRSTFEQQNPDVQLKCDESKEGGDWFLGSTWEPSGRLAKGVVNVGLVIIGFPKKPDNERYVVPNCTNAHVQLIASKPGSFQTIVVNYPVGADIAADAERQPLGPSLPLPDAAT